MRVLVAVVARCRAGAGSGRCTPTARRPGPSSRSPTWPPRSPRARRPTSPAGSGRPPPRSIPALLRAGVRVDRCHDVELTEALLLGHAGRWGEPRVAGRRLGPAGRRPGAARPAAAAAAPPGEAQGALFEAVPAPPAAAGSDDLRGT